MYELLIYLLLPITNSNGHCQCHENFKSEYLWNGDRWGKITTTIKMASHIWVLDWHIYIWPWLIPNVMVKVRHILPAKMLEIVFAMANITITDKQEVMCGLSINIFASDLDPFHRSRSWSCTISTANILEMVTNKASITTAIKLEDRHEILIERLKTELTARSQRVPC